MTSYLPFFASLFLFGCAQVDPPCDEGTVYTCNQ